MITTAVIIFGGKSLRYGRPKGLETVGDTTLVGKIADEIRAAGITDIHLSTDDSEIYSDLGLPMVQDRYPGCGPLAGIHSALVETGAERILVLPCDLPGITAAEIRKLLQYTLENPAQVVFAVTETNEHPLCSVVSSELVDVLDTALKSGHHAALRFFRGVDHNTVYIDNDRAFHNVNTPDDFKKWEDSNVL